LPDAASPPRFIKVNALAVNFDGIKPNFSFAVKHVGRLPWAKQ
jgi:hypothetical protein